MSKPKWPDRTGCVVIIIVLGVLALWILFGWVAPYIVECFGSEGKGQFGDQFGAVNSLFAGFAFIGVIYTLLVQQKEIAAAKQKEADNEAALKIQLDFQAQIATALKDQAEFQTRSFATLERQAMLQAQSALINANAALLNQRTTELHRAHRLAVGSIKIPKRDESGEIVFEFVELEEAKQRFSTEAFILKESLEKAFKDLEEHESLKPKPTQDSV